jgi:hypothetical protein
LKENMRGSPYCVLLQKKSLCTNKGKKKEAKGALIASIIQDYQRYEA